MRAPYGMNILDNCLNCPVRDERLFCDLSMSALQNLNQIKSTAIYPERAVLFTEGQKARGAFILCSGRVKLSASANGGRTIILKISEPGDVLGLSASIANHPYEVTAEMIEPGQANFISREALLQFLRSSSEVAVHAGQALSLSYYYAHEEIRTLGVTRSPEERLAKLLLSWFAAKENGRGLQIKLTFTHSEIGEMIGATRETVTRLFSDLSRRQIVQRLGATLTLRNRSALAQLVH